MLFRRSPISPWCSWSAAVPSSASRPRTSLQLAAGLSARSSGFTEFAATTFRAPSHTSFGPDDHRCVEASSTTGSLRDAAALRTCIGGSPADRPWCCRSGLGQR